MAKKRADGEGSLYKEASRGRWVGEVVIDGRRHRVTAKTKVDAGAKLAALIREHPAAALRDGRTMTVTALLEVWAARELAARDSAPKTLDLYRWSISHLEAQLGSVKLGQLTVERIERALDELTAGGLGRRSLKSVRSTLGQALDFAQRRGLIDSNPARLALLTATAAKPVPRQALAPEQIGALWSALEGRGLGPLFRLQLLTGLRPGEAAGVLWSDVDLDAGLLVVRHAVRVEGGVARLVDELKTTASFRTIALPAPAVAVLEAQRARVDEMRAAAGARWRERDLCFPTDTGGPVDPSNARRELAMYCRTAGLPELTPNELRHTAATVLIDQGVPVELVADLLGHSNLRMLAEHYRHRVRPAANAAVGVFDALVAPST